MAEYIERETLVNRLDNLAYDDWNQGASTTWAAAYSECAEIVRDIPAADVQPVVHGHWIVRRGNYNEEFECSECQHISKDGGNYCSHCGARMDEE